MDYTALIIEDIDFLASQERLSSKAQVRDRIGFLRVLKTGQAHTLAFTSVWLFAKASAYGKLIKTRAFPACFPLLINLVLENYRLIKSASCSLF